MAAEKKIKIQHKHMRNATTSTGVGRITVDADGMVEVTATQARLLLVSGFVVPGTLKKTARRGPIPDPKAADDLPPLSDEAAKAMEEAFGEEIVKAATEVVNQDEIDAAKAMQEDAGSDDPKPMTRADIAKVQSKLGNRTPPPEQTRTNSRGQSRLR